MVVGQDGRPVVNPARSSYGTFMSQFMKDPVIMKAEGAFSLFHVDNPSNSIDSPSGIRSVLFLYLGS